MKNIKIIIPLIIILAVVGTMVFNFNNEVETIQIFKYLGNNQPVVEIYMDNYQTGEIKRVARGTKVEVISDNANSESQLKVKIKLENDDRIYWVNSNYLVDEFNEIVLEKEVYVQYYTNLLDENSKILAYLEEGTKLDVISYDLDKFGSVPRYKVKYNNIEGYVNSHYLVYSKEEIKNKYTLDYLPKKYADFNFKPRKKPNYESNPYRDDIKAIYLSIDTLLSSSFDIDKYIKDLTVNSPINAFVFDIKHDYGDVLFDSDTVKEFGTNASRRSISKEKLSEIIKKVKDNNIYLIGRIVTFKDNYFASAYPNTAVTFKSNGQFYRYNQSTYISPYTREIWEYNVGIAKEAAELGFNEIQYDYVRFSEYIKLDIHNVPKPIEEEGRAQAIQRFLEYAKDQLESYQIYLGADVYGITSYLDNDAMTLGQFFEAVSTTVDVLCPMAYPSHYPAYKSQADPSIVIGWPNTYEEYELILKYYTQDLFNRNNRLPEPANLRIWIEGYSNDYLNTDDKIPAQVSGLKYNNVNTYLFWGNGYSYNIDAIRLSEDYE